jgi:copper homeostasis protein
MNEEMVKWVIEIATSDYATTAAAVAGGADRIELCANLAEGGTTPSMGTIRLCREKFTVDLFPIIRPRGGDFLYTEEEFQIMLKDVQLCKQLGCDGVVVGVLSSDGTIDIARTSALVNAAYPLDVTFHRAFDRCKDPLVALEQLIELGCARILTSGQQPSVVDGVQLVAALNKQADDRILIMPGSGVRRENIKMLAAKTGCAEFHSSLRGKERSRMEFMHPAFKESAESYMNNAVDAEEVRGLRNALQ